MDAEIHPLFIYAKSDHPDLTADQRKEVTKDVEEIKEAQRKKPAARKPASNAVFGSMEAGLKESLAYVRGEIDLPSGTTMSRPRWT
jgi:hypothetical protein